MRLLSAAALYDERIRARVEPDQNGKVLVIDIETGAYEVDDDGLAAADRIFTRRPEAALYMLRVGQPAMDRIGTRLTMAARS